MFGFNVFVHPHAGTDELLCIKLSLAKISKLLENLMSVISTFAAQQTAFNARLDASLTGIGDDITSLNAKIAELQNSSGAVTPEDQALIDDLVAKGEALAAKFEAADALIPPPTPVE